MTDTLEVPDTQESIEEAPEEQKKRGWGRWIFRGVAVLIVLCAVGAYFLPQIIERLVANHSAVEWLAPEMAKSIDIGGAKIEWGKPVSLQSVTLKSESGAPIAQVASIKSKQNFWDMLWGKPKPLELQLQGIDFKVQVPEPRSEGGSLQVAQITNAISAFKIPTPPQPMSVEAEGISIHFVGPDAQPVESWTGISLDYSYTKGGTGEQTVSLVMSPEKSQEDRGRLKIDGKWIGGDKETITLEGNWNGLSLEPAVPWIETSGIALKPSATGTGTIRGNLDRQSTKSWDTVLHLTSNLPIQLEEPVVDEVVVIPSQEEPPPELILGLEAGFDESAKRLTIAQLSVVSDPAQVHASGTVADVGKTEQVDLSGSIDVKNDTLMKSLPDALREELNVEGLQVSEFALTGPLNPPDDGMLGLTCRLGWTELSGYGLVSRQGELSIELADGTVSATPIDMSVNEGRIHQFPQTDLKTKPPTLTFVEGPVLEKVNLSEEVSREWLKYIAPLLADAVSTEGQFSLSTLPGTLPIGEPESGSLAGTLTIHGAEVKPGPIAVPIEGVIKSVQRLIPGFRIGKLSDMRLLTIQSEEVNYRLEAGRVHHDDFSFRIGNVRLATSGFVGLDETLDLMLTMYIPVEWLPGDGPLARMLENERIQVRVGGTFDEPLIDTSPLKDFGRRVGIRAGAGLLQNLFQRRRRNREEPVPEELPLDE